MQWPTMRSLGLVGITLIGIWVIIQAAFMVFFLLGAFATESSREWLWPQLLPVGGQMILGILLICARLPLARVLFPNELSPKQVGQDVRPFLDFLVALLGLWFLVTAFTQGAQSEAALISGFAAQREFGLGGDFLSYAVSRDVWVGRIPHLARAACGAALIVWSAGVVEVWERLRSAGRSDGPAT